MKEAEPQRIERIGEAALKVLWKDGHESHYPWPLLRKACPCAACREGPAPAPEESIRPREIRPVGRYAMTLRWSDGHTTGIFSFDYLRSLCPCEGCTPRQMTEG